MDKVSILIPVFNREKYVIKTIESALNQTYSNIEIIVVDNFSTDNTWEVLKEIRQSDDRIKIFQNEDNVGPVKNWERCINEASGKYAKILWSDDLITSDFIQKTLPFLVGNDEVGFAFSGTKIFNSANESEKKVFFVGETGLFPKEKYIDGVLLSYSYPVSPGCAIFRLEDLKDNLLIEIPNKINVQSSMHGIGSDLLIFLSVLNNYNFFAFVNEPLSLFRDHENSISSSEDRAKLILYYNIAKAYYVENYYPSFVRKLNSRLIVDMLLFDGNKYNLNSLSSFYLNNTCFKFSIKGFCKILTYKIKGKF